MEGEGSEKQLAVGERHIMNAAVRGKLRPTPATNASSVFSD